MKLVILILRVVAILFILGGGVWILQGINILPGSFMTGQIRWAYAGILAVLVGFALLILTRGR